MGWRSFALKQTFQPENKLTISAAAAAAVDKDPIPTVTKSKKGKNKRKGGESEWIPATKKPRIEESDSDCSE